MADNNPFHTYRGRFAPSPTGPLHMGSMLAALGSFLQAKHQRGKWLVRIEDLDPPREIKGAADDILQTLESFGLEWDEPVVYQSRRHDLYEQALQQLNQAGLLYPCVCSRKTIKQKARTGPIGFIYPGTCRNHSVTQNPFALRLKTTNLNIQFQDVLQGLKIQNIAQQIGDVVLKRADGLYAYHLAVVVDDEQQKVTEVVRGYDLFECTPIQIYMQRMLNYSTPSYLHLPVLVNSNQEKLSKQTKAKPVSKTRVEETLCQLLVLLNQNPPSDLLYEKREDILAWAITNWKVKNIVGHEISYQ